MKIYYENPRNISFLTFLNVAKVWKELNDFFFKAFFERLIDVQTSIESWKIERELPRQYIILVEQKSFGPYLIAKLPFLQISIASVRVCGT